MATSMLAVNSSICMFSESIVDSVIRQINA
jgi:hypothetical protein